MSSSRSGNGCTQEEKGPVQDESKGGTKNENLEQHLDEEKGTTVKN
jgi:hypothetical protein